jgi:Na+-translocating ferredoxin:NAD+ oxidoreductase RnfG subunit/ferredoxin
LHRNTRCVAGFSALLLLVTSPVAAQEPPAILPELLRAVMPAAERFGPHEGQPPVIRAYATDSATGRESLIGYVFLTSDLPPEEMGYNGPIDVLVGMDLGGTLTGARVIDYYESLRRSDGDFLRRRGFQEQFEGKHLSQPFRVRRDVDGISGATISVAAMARGIRNAARRVANAYLAAPDPDAELTAEAIAQLNWPDLLDRGLAQRMRFEKDGVLRIEILLVRIRDANMATALIGGAAWERVRQQAGERLDTGLAWFVGLDGGLDALFRPQILHLAREADTLRFGTADYIALGEPRAGIVDAQLRSHGVLLVPAAVDPAQPFTWVADFGTDIGADSARFNGEGPRTIVTQPALARSAVVPADTPEGAPLNVPADSSAPERDTAQAPVSAYPLPADSAGREGESRPVTRIDLDFADDEDETVLQRTMAQTSWPRFFVLAAVLALALLAFFSKKDSIRWVSLAGTLVLLGFGGIGFLSVSHITSAIEVGPRVFLEDFTLLLFVCFTVLTTLLWGRVFCGYLCPFGALQDFLDRFVPERFKRELPAFLHKRALVIKYAVLVIVVLPALLGSTVSLFQYAEPFGTVFFLSPSIGLWSIAAIVLAAAAIIPRFYCRYVCPLGASLAIASVLSPFRIRRVEQCTVCKVCEQDCPTGAITGPTIDFKECVRCNICEIDLIERAGVCRHDMSTVRAQLVQLQMRGRRGANP